MQPGSVLVCAVQELRSQTEAAATPHCCLLSGQQAAGLQEELVFKLAPLWTSSCLATCIAVGATPRDYSIVN